MNPPPSIAFIGGGNMARGIIGGLVNADQTGESADHLWVSDPLAERRAELAERFGVAVFPDNAQCAERGEVVVLAVKPRFLRQAVESISAVLQRQKPLVISIAAGIRCADLLRWAGGPLALVRAMPNTPALVNAGISGLFANELATEQHRALAQTILGAVGETLWVGEEALLDAVTAVSGSGPAYFFKLMELMSASAVQHGLDLQTADTLATHTALGAATLARHEHAIQTPAMLRHQVTSPGGTTEAALAQMEICGFDAAVRQGIAAAVKRAGELADQFGAPAPVGDGSGAP